VSGLRVIVFSCSDLGNEVANRLRTLNGVGKVAVMYAAHRLALKKVSAVEVLKRKWKLEGPVATLRALAGRVLPFLREQPTIEGSEIPLDGDIERFEVSDFHDAAAIEQIRSFTPDLGVVAGTYILKESVFGLPRLGSINLHSGRAPEYRGAAPVFWELYNGETHLGITIHRVTAKLDSGHILAQELFPLDRAPTGEPMSYVARYREDVLRPNGVRMLSDVVAAIANDRHTETPQDPTNAKTYRRPDYRAIKELRRRVGERRKGHA
jgi:methionyl-tRNA formyltransferase